MQKDSKQYLFHHLLCFINFQSTFSFRNFAGSLKLHALYSFYFHDAHSHLYDTTPLVDITLSLLRHISLKYQHTDILNVYTCYYHTSLLITPHDLPYFSCRCFEMNDSKNLSSNDNRHNFSLLIHTSIHIWQQNGLFFLYAYTAKASKSSCIKGYFLKKRMSTS